MSKGNFLNSKIDTSGLTRSEKKLMEEAYKNSSFEHKEHHPKCDDKKKHDCNKKNDNWDETSSDYIVVGAGASGSMIIRLLSNDFNTSVVGIERGLYLVDDPVVVDNVNLAAPLRRPKNDDIYEINEQGQANGIGLLGNFNLEFGSL